MILIALEQVNLLLMVAQTKTSWSPASFFLLGGVTRALWFWKRVSLAH